MTSVADAVGTSVDVEVSGEVGLKGAACYLVIWSCGGDGGWIDYCCVCEDFEGEGAYDLATE